LVPQPKRVDHLRRARDEGVDLQSHEEYPILLD
jgi:hypothetical protein